MVWPLAGTWTLDEAVDAHVEDLVRALREAKLRSAGRAVWRIVAATDAEDGDGRWARVWLEMEVDREEREARRDGVPYTPVGWDQVLIVEVPAASTVRRVVAGCAA